MNPNPALPPVPPIRPFKALEAYFGLMRNKEDTSQVFKFSYNINGDCLQKTFKRWYAGPNAKLLIDEDPQALLKALDDRDRLRSLPLGTVGRTYADFMDREGLSTDGVAESYREDGLITDQFKEEYPEYYAFVWFLNLTHDLYHVLTGYNRDSLGEVALLNYTCRITRNRGIKYLAALASLKIKSDAFDVPVFEVMANGRKMGDASFDLLHADFIGILERPLRDVQAEFNIVPDPVYAALPQKRLLALNQPQTA